MNVTSVKNNPLANMTIDWTDKMAADFRKYEGGVKTVFPRCRLSKATTVAVSINVWTIFNYQPSRTQVPQAIWEIRPGDL